MGAAILGRYRAGVFKDFSVIARFVRIEQTVQPIPENRAKYEAWMPVFDKAIMLYMICIPRLQKLN